MPLAITDVITLSTADEIEAEILSICVTKELPVTSWQSGSVIRTIIRILSESIALKGQLDVEASKGGLGDLASPEWAKVWADALYDVQYGTAEAATGLINAVNATNTNYDFDAGELIVANKINGKTYRNQAVISVPANDSLDDIAISSDEIGTVADAAPGDIIVVVNGLTGLTVTNPEAVLGSDEETTEALVRRARAKFSTLSPNGVKGAYDFVVQTPELCPTSSRITRSRTIADALTGLVSVYIANADGAPSGADVDIAQTAIDFWSEPWCVGATAIAAAELVVDVSYQVWLKTSLTTAQVESYVSIALANHFASIPVGGVIIPPDSGSIYLERIEYVIHGSVSGVERVLITLPTDDLVLTPNQVPVLGTVTATVSFL